MKISNYLSSETSQSSMRLVFFICGITACSISVVSTIFYFILSYQGKGTLDISSISLLVGVLLGAATAGKVGQSATEAKLKNKEK